jgi:hypothetical protein
VKRRDYSRKSANKPNAKKIIKILCEGKKTEPFYIRELIKSLGFPHEHASLLKHCGKTNPQGLYKEAEKVLRKGACDIIYIIRDGDVVPDSLSTNPKIIEIISIPCFELWFLLHFSDGKKPFGKCVDVVSELQKHLSGYEKNQGSIFEEIKEYMETAKDRASDLRKEKNISQTNIHEFILALQEEARNLNAANP